MRLRGYQLTRYADNWVVTCKSAAEARAAVDAARRILKQLGVELHPQKTRIIHVRYGFEFLGYKIKRGWTKLRLPESKIRSGLRAGALYAYPRVKSSSSNAIPIQIPASKESANPVSVRSDPLCRRFGNR
jgi:RNA-directed DNA polymerase